MRAVETPQPRPRGVVRAVCNESVETPSALLSSLEPTVFPSVDETKRAASRSG